MLSSNYLSHVLHNGGANIEVKPHKTSNDIWCMRKPLDLTERVPIYVKVKKHSKSCRHFQCNHQIRDLLRLDEDKIPEMDHNPSSNGSFIQTPARDTGGIPSEASLTPSPQRRVGHIASAASYF